MYVFIYAPRRNGTRISSPIPSARNRTQKDTSGASASNSTALIFLKKALIQHGFLYTVPWNVIFFTAQVLPIFSIEAPYKKKSPPEGFDNFRQAEY